MRGTSIGEFEELVLLMVIINSENAYMMTIRDELKKQVNRNVSMGALHVTLSRLEKKGFLTSEMRGASAKRGGRRKRYYNIAAAGKKILRDTRDLRKQLWEQIPSLTLNTPNA